MMTHLYTLRRKLLLFFLSAFSLPGLLFACDTSGYNMNGITDNGDGTFTINWTALVAGGTSTGVGSTWGFYLNIDATILSITPSSFTSSNGTTLNAVISGGNVQWGNPAPFSGPVFLDITTQPNDESFPFTMVVSGIPTEWWGGGQEANQCPGGPGTGGNYEGVFPCFEPVLTPSPDVVHICPGETVTLSVVPNHLVEDIVWEPGGETTPSITVTLFQDQLYTITGSNVGCSTQTTIQVIIDPLPYLTPQEPNVEVCQGTPAVLVVNAEATDLITWSPGSAVGPVLVVVPNTSPATYTATGFNECGQTSISFNVTTVPFPTVSTSNDVAICQGESVQLIANPVGSTQVLWQPGNTMGNNITVSPTSTTTYFATVSNFCGTDTADVVVTVATNNSNNVQLAACPGETVLYNNIPLAAGSNSTFTFTNYIGCDSVVTVNVATLPNSTGTLTLTACQGETASYLGQNLAIGSSTQFNLTAFNGCDSVLTVSVTGLPNYTSTLNLQACAGETVNYNGQQLQPGSSQGFTFQAVNGCDSTVTVNVANLPTFTSALTLQTCPGTTVNYNGQQLQPNTTTDFTLSAQNGCDSVVTVTVEELAVLTSSLDVEACTGSTYAYNGQQLQPNSVTDFSFTTANGCDSIVTVTVAEVSAFQENISYDACTGTTISYNGQSLQPGSVTDFSFTTAQGCDSMVTVTVVELPNYATPLTLQTCTGVPISYAGLTLQPGSTTPVTLTAQNGCDSVVTVVVDEIQTLTTQLELKACQGGTVFYQGSNLAPNSVTDFTFASSLGCDSIVTVTVELLETFSTAVALEACQGTTASYNGLDLPPGTDINFTYTAVNGCDSVVNVTVSEVTGFQTLLNLETCPGSTIDYNGQQLAPGSLSQFDFTSTTGCDSTVTVTVTALPTYASALSLQACEGGTVIYNGQPLSPGTNTDFILAASNGCDSVVTVTVTQINDINTFLTLYACPGNTAIYNGQPLSIGSSTPFTFAAAQGCDSIVTVTVTALPTAATSLTLAACPGSTATYNGQQLQPGSVTPFTFDTWQGCDSVVTVTVSQLLPQASNLTLQACTGTTVSYNGQTLSPGTVTDVVLDTWQGCDSVVTITVVELPVLTGAVSLQGCQNETLVYDGQTLQPGTVTEFTFTSFSGCDSIVTVTALPAIPTVSTSESIEICEGGSAVIFGQAVSLPGIYSQTFTGSNGCDSTHAVTLEVANNVSVSFPDDLTVPLGQTVVLNPLTVPATGLSYEWLEDPTLSCLDCPSPIASPLTQTSYTLTVTDAGGCTASATQLIQVKGGAVYIPNSFSPNDDGINDIFLVFSDGKSVKEINSFLIFSRWGETVFQGFHLQPDNFSQGWNGTHRGKKMDLGVFVYVAEVEFVDGRKQLYKGDVTMVR